MHVTVREHIVRALVHGCAHMRLYICVQAYYSRFEVSHVDVAVAVRCELRVIRHTLVFQDKRHRTCHQTPVELLRNVVFANRVFNGACEKVLFLYFFWTPTLKCRKKASCNCAEEKLSQVVSTRAQLMK